MITAFTLLSVLWGGTYLAMRVGVEHMAPYTLAAVRYMTTAKDALNSLSRAESGVALEVHV